MPQPLLRAPRTREGRPLTDRNEFERLAVLETRVGFLEKRADAAKDREHFIINAIITLVIAYVRGP